MNTLFQHIHTALLSELNLPSLNIEWNTPPKGIYAHFCTSWSLPNARALNTNPMALAERLSQSLQGIAGLEKIWVTKPGFVNILFTPEALMNIALEAHAPSYSSQGRLLLEYVSANPTGPLHLGHARQAALGKALANIYQRAGWNVTHEYYYNNEGNQIHTLGLSVQAWMKHYSTGVALFFPSKEEHSSSHNDAIVFDADWYHGSYISDIAHAALKMGIDPDNFEALTTFAVDAMFANQQQTLHALDIHFDHYALESTYHQPENMDQVLNHFIAAEDVYLQDGALFFKGTKYGLDKDFVVQKSNTTYAYCFPDIVYHADKFARKYDKMINVQGVDHQYTVHKVKAGLTALGLDATRVQYVLHSMVHVLKDKKPVKPSKRAGNYVSLDDIFEVTGKDSLLFSLLENSIDKPLTLDLDILTAKGLDNPVYYAQMAHARITSLLALKYNNVAEMQSSSVYPGQASEVLIHLADYPNVLSGSMYLNSPHLLYKHTMDLAKYMHGLYSSIGPVDALDAANKQAVGTIFQMCLVQLRDCLQLLGVEAPLHMD